MDNHDEAKHDDDRPIREGDVLGLGGSAVPKAPGDPHAEYDEESVARRRARSRGKDEPETVTTEMPQTSGATGIDMGAGGSGTDVE
jgi:hypothetical protein